MSEFVVCIPRRKWPTYRQADSSFDCPGGGFLGKVLEGSQRTTEKMIDSKLTNCPLVEREEELLANFADALHYAG